MAQYSRQFGIVFGRQLTISQISRKYGISLETIRSRVKLGKKDEDLIRVPNGPGAQKGTATRPVTCFGSYYGKLLSAKELSEMTGIKSKTCLERIRKGWTDDKLITPVELTLKERDNRLVKMREIRRANLMKELMSIPVPPPPKAPAVILRTRNSELPIGFRPGVDER